MANKDDFSIETKLKISGVEAVGKLDAGTLVFNIDTSSLQKAIAEAGKTASQITKTFSKINIPQLKIEINKNSLKSIEAQIKNAVQNAVGKVTLSLSNVSAKGGGADPFKEQKASSIKMAATLDKVNDALRAFHNGVRSLLSTLNKGGSSGPVSRGSLVGKSGPDLAAITGLPLPSNARGISGSLSSLSQEIGNIGKQLDLIPKHAFDEFLNIPGLKRDVDIFSQSLQGELVKALFASGEQASKATQRITNMVEVLNRLRAAQGKGPLSQNKALNELDKISQKQSAGEARSVEKAAQIRDAANKKALDDIDRQTAAEARALAQAIKLEEARENAKTRAHQKALQEIDQRTAAEVRALQRSMSLDSQLAAKRASDIQKSAELQMQADQERIANINKLKSELDQLFSKERRITSQLSGAGGGAFGGGGNLPPPGGFGSFPPDGPGGGGNPRELQLFAKNIRDITSESKRASSAMEELDALAFQVGRKAAAFRGVAIAINTVVDSIKSGVQFIISFTDSVLELNKILQYSESGLQRVANRLFDLASTTGVSVDETVKIAQEFARAGLEGRGYGSVIDLTEQALRGLQGTSLDAGQATNVLIQIIQQIETGARGLNKELITSGKLFDILGRVEDITASKADDFAEAFKRSGASLVATGASIEEIAGLLSVVQERTQRGGEVIGTAFKTIATRISDTGSEAAGALKSIGVEVADSSGRLRNINDILRDTADRFSSLTETEQANIAVKVAGVRQIEVFRNTVSNFSRVLDIQREATLAEGDAARKQGVEQQKLGNIIERIKISFQKLIKTTSEGVFGTAFKVAIQTGELLFKVIGQINDALGGVVTNFAGIFVGVGAIKILSGLFQGMLKTAKFFAGSLKESSDGLKGINKSAQITKTAGIDPMNNAFKGSVELIQFMNQQMQSFQLQTQLAATQAERLVKARALAEQKVSSVDRLSNPNAVNQETKAILAQQNLQERIQRNRSIKSAVQTFGAGTVNSTVQNAPALFSERERAVSQRRAEIEQAGGRQKFFNDKRSTLGLDKFNSEITSTNKNLFNLGKGLGFLQQHALAIGLAAGTAGSLLGAASDKLEESGQTGAAAITSIVASIGQFAGVGSLFGGVGIAIGAVGGAILGFTKLLERNTLTVQSLQKEYEKLGIIQEESGQISDAVAQTIERAFADIKAFQNFQTAKQNTALEQKLDPKKAAQRQALAEKELANAGKNLLASFDLSGTKEANLNKIRDFLSGLQKTTTSGSALGLSQEALTPGSRGVLAVTKDVKQEVVGLLEKTINEIAGDQGLKKFADLLANINQKIDEETKKIDIAESIKDFGKIAEQVIPPILLKEKGSTSRIDRGSGTVSNIASGLLVKGTKEFTDAVGGLREQVGRGEVKTTGGKALDLNAFDELIKRAVSLGEQSRRGASLAAGGRAGIELGDILKEAIPLLTDIAETAKKQEAIQTRQALLLSQKGVIGNINLNRGLDFSDLSKPIDNLEIALRKFTDGFSKSSLRLEQAMLRAVTPQKELANVMAQQAQKELEISRGQRSTVISDIGATITKALQDIGGGQFIDAIDQATGQLKPGFTEEDAKITRDQIRSAILDGIFSASDEIKNKGILNPEDQRKIFAQRLQQSTKGTFGEEEFSKILEVAGDALDKLNDADIEVANSVERLSQAELAALQNRIAEEEKAIEISDRRRNVIKTEAQASLEALTGLRRLSAERVLESSLLSEAIDQQTKFVKSLDQSIASNKARVDADKLDISAQNQLEELTKKRVDEQIKLEDLLAQKSVEATKFRLDALQEIISASKNEADFLKSRVSAQTELTNILRIGGGALDEFNTKLDDNAQQFRISQADLATQIEVINNTIDDQAEKEARLAEVHKQAASLAIESAKAEAEIIAARREAVKQATSELLNNQQEQIQAQKEVIDATKNVGAAFEQYKQAVQGAILASTQYTLNLKLAGVEAQKVTGAFTGIRQEILATQKIFSEAEQAVRDLGGSEKTLLEIRRQSISQQISLFSQLLNEQASLAKSFFQSSSQDQADLFLGIQEAGSVANLLGGSFDKFRQLGEKAINDIGAQLLALPQETRQRVISSLETLRGIGGSVGGFSADELLTAIETASLGVSKEGLNVDPLFEVQQKIATLTEEQARLATEQLIAANDQVKTSKSALDEAVAQKDLAEIQLERIQEEGDKLRNKLDQLNGGLNTILLKQDDTNRSGFDLVTRAIQRTTDAITNTLPSTLSAKFAESLSSALIGTGFNIQGINGPQTNFQQQGNFNSNSRGLDLAKSMRENNSNSAQLQQMFNSSGPSINITGSALNNSAQNSTSNIGNTNDIAETNQKLASIVDELKNLNTTTSDNNQLLTSISEVGTGGVGTTSTINIPDISVNIQGQQQVTVTGFESGVQTIISGLIKTFGSFVTETQARNIANDVVNAIRTQLQRLNIISPNQI